MKKMIGLLAVVVALSGIAYFNSTKATEEENKSTTAAPASFPFSAPPAANISPAAGAGAINPAHGQPGHRCDLAVGAPLNSKPTAPAFTPAPPAIPTATTTAGATTGKMNPAHGQPGHRCDIAVGAPLDSKPNTPTLNPAQPQASISTPTPVVAASTPAGKNPAHGQPGHRCDIAVGAPLNSKPVAQTPTISPVTPAQKININPAANVAVANGKNPAHGQPGHRCDLAVGASLDSANAAKKQ